MRLLRWLVLLPTCAAAFYLTIAATIATHYLVEQNLCPVADFDRGICNNRSLGLVLEAIKLGGPALTVIVVAAMAVIVAPVHKQQVLWVSLALLLVVATWFGLAATAGSSFFAALAGGVLAAAVIPRFLRSRSPAA